MSVMIRISLYEEIGQIPADVIGTPDMHFSSMRVIWFLTYKKDKVYILEGVSLQ